MRAVGCESLPWQRLPGPSLHLRSRAVTHALQHLINSRAHPAEFHKQALKDGYIPMRGYGFQKVLSGETTIEEVLSVTAADPTVSTIRRPPPSPLQPTPKPQKR
jgi:general secretion pathway protein E